MAMSRKDIVPFAVLIGLLLGWPYIDRLVIKKNFFHEPPAVAKPAGEPAPAAAASEAVEQPATEPVLAAVPEGEVAAAAALPAEADVEADDATPATLFEMGNDVMTLTLSTRGAAVEQVVLKEYVRTLGSEEPVTLDFAGRSALAVEGLLPKGRLPSFAVVEAETRRAVLEAPLGNGLVLRRVIELGDRYLTRVVETVENPGTEAVALPAGWLRTGPMRREPGHKDSAGVITLGVDSLSPGGEKVQHWGKKFQNLFESERDERSLPGLPLLVDRSPRKLPVDWVAAKNKYFVQILTPEGGAEDSRVYARRERAPAEVEDEQALPRKMTAVQEVGSALALAGQVVPAGGSVEWVFTWYAGPKKYSELHAMRLHQVDTMEFGDWIKPISKLLLKVLNGIHAVIPNYGVAIILLTIIVRVIFWPITHKSTESMKRMQQVAPLVNEIRAKYKDNPQKQQQAIMELYKEHKVNPIGGCLPMLIQIPVFFALFVVLRSAIELRFASFLWIRDLSEAENLFAGMIPFVGSLNLLPLLMAGTMYLQMKLSPSAGDPAQQKIMAVMMPVMMLVFLYNFASGLALYWTTQNVLMIVQQMWQRKHNKPLVPATAKG